MEKGIVYILTNPCLDGWVKIGMTERNDVGKRLQELNSPTNIPLSYRCYATYEVVNPLEVEKRIHSLIDKVDNSLHAREQLGNGKIREREFFRISPETAYGIFVDIAELRNDRENLKIYEPTTEQAKEEEIADIKTRRTNNSFKLLGLPAGTEIAFLFDDRIVAKVLDDLNSVQYENEKYSVTALARKLLVEKRGWLETSSANGWRYFTTNGVTLSDLRNAIENGNTEN